MVTVVLFCSLLFASSALDPADGPIAIQIKHDDRIAFDHVAALLTREGYSYRIGGSVFAEMYIESKSSDFLELLKEEAPINYFSVRILSGQQTLREFNAGNGLELRSKYRTLLGKDVRKAPFPMDKIWSTIGASDKQGIDSLTIIYKPRMHLAQDMKYHVAFEIEVSSGAKTYFMQLIGGEVVVKRLK